jgi:hypothetical protein
VIIIGPTNVESGSVPFGHMRVLARVAKVAQFGQ